MVTSPRPQHYSFDEYLDLEKAADYKSEYHNGEIYAMSGGTRTHSRLSARIIVLLSLSLPKCEGYDSNMNLYIEQISKGVYPDCMALCTEVSGEVSYYKGRRDAIVNPTLVVEVLSPSTERYDQETKVADYHSVPSIQHILLVSQDRVLVDHYSRIDSQTWTMIRYSHCEDTLQLMSIRIEVERIYANIV